MQISRASRQNLRRDRNVLGKQWGKTYKGYFGNRAHMKRFGSIVESALPARKNVSVLYVGSASGGLGEGLVKSLNKKGRKANLTLLDISQDHLDQNKNPKTRKIRGDILIARLPKRFDVIMMRSTLDYFPTDPLQVRVLARIRSTLSADSVFVNQAASLSTKAERNLADMIYRSNPKIGNRHFQWGGDVETLYRKAGFSRFGKLGDAPKLVITDKEHRERYRMTREEVARIRKLIAQIPKSQRPNIELTKTGYKMTFLFPVYAAWN